jgi:hypothetical protein
MFNADNVKIDLRIADIVCHVSEYDIFKRYCSGFEELNKSFCSEFYTDTRPSCRITQNANNKLNYVDYGNGDALGCFDYVMKKYCCNLVEALNIIANDFGILKIKTVDKPQFILGENSNIKPKVRPKSTITINPREWSDIDIQYWGAYYISIPILNEYNVIPCQNVYLHKGDRTIVFTHSDDNPIYAYRFESEGKYSYKIYFPLAKDKSRKWLFSGGLSTDIEGYDQLELSGEKLILTKSLKDCMVYRVLGYNAISLQGEANRLDRDLVYKLLKRFDKIIINYDNDEQGIKSSDRLKRQYGFDSFIIPVETGFKDLSDYIKVNGLRSAEKLLNELIIGQNEDILR